MSAFKFRPTPTSKDVLRKALDNKAAGKYTTNPLLRAVPYKDTKPLKSHLKANLKDHRIPDKKTQMKQYGDKGYKPATGSGTGN